MAHYATLQSYKFQDEDSDLRGAELYGTGDEKLGTIEDVIIDHRDGFIRYAVVDTGGWLHHRRFMVPAEVIHPYGRNTAHLAADLTKKQIESFPPYRENVTDSPESWDRYERQYREHWESHGSVAHQIGSDRLVTPPADEVPIEPGSMAAMGGTPGSVPDLTPRRMVSPTKLPGGPTSTLHVEEETATSHAVLPTHDNSSGAVHSFDAEGGARWAAFQNSVRRHLPNIRKTCTTCGCVDMERKAS